jgi:hypothetical protein
MKLKKELNLSTYKGEIEFNNKLKNLLKKFYFQFAKIKKL